MDLRLLILADVVGSACSSRNSSLSVSRCLENVRCKRNPLLRARSKNAGMLERSDGSAAVDRSGEPSSLVGKTSAVGMPASKR